MRIFLDACVDPRVAGLLTGHEVTDAFQRGWHQLKDNALLPRVQGQFDVFVTADQGIEFEHNLGTLHFGIVIVHVEKNKIEFYRPLASDLLAAVERVAPGQVIHVGRHLE